MMTWLASILLTSSVGAAELHPMLHDPPAKAWFVNSGSDERSPEWAICLRAASHADADRLAVLIPTLGGRILSRLHTTPILTLLIPPHTLESIASLPGAIWIEPAPLPLTPCMDSARPDVGIDVLHSPAWNLEGEGQRVVIVEPSLPDIDHPDLAGRVTTFSSGISSAHATHVAGIIAGNGILSSGTWTGTAPNVMLDARVINNVDDYFFYSDPGNLESLYEDELAEYTPIAFNQSLGSNIQLNGYPCSLHGDYGVTAELLDGIVRGELGTPVTSVWAAGNERAYDTCGYDYGTIGQPATAKNVISVGAVYSDSNVVTIFSSWGPTDDGRIKPDIVAPGSQLSDDFGITSCGEQSTYATMSGTSMATPIVSGTLALLAELHQQAWPDAPPPLPSTWRAILCHTAEDLWQDGPDYRYGWGLLDAEAAAESTIAHNWTENSLLPSDLASYVIEVEDPSEPLRVTLAWDDLPAVAGTAETLMNDLDLLLVHPSSGLVSPWSLDPNNPNQPAQRNVDRVNTIEQVYVADPEPGTWTVYVSGTSITEPTGQAYSLVSSPPMAHTLLSIVSVADHGVHWTPTPVTAQIKATGETIVEGSTLLYASVDGETPISTPLVQNGETWTANLPPAGCGSTITWWIEAQSSLTGTQTLPLGAPSVAFTLPVGDLISTIFTDSMESDLGWSVTTSASSGAWHHAEPGPWCENRGEPTFDSEEGSTYCLMTQRGNSADCGDLDNGCSWLTSPAMNASMNDLTLSYARWFSNGGCGHSHDDGFLIEFSIDDGINWIVLEAISEDDPDATGGWVDRSFALSDISGFQPTSDFRLRFTACDEGSSDCVEAAIDAVSLLGPPCVTLCRQDIANADGLVDVADLLRFIEFYGTDNLAADFDNTGIVGIDDLLILMAAWGPCI
ncbi:MAG: S8 family serine peptidase [Planctomycetes bacterium]|nr:S8 family serine peptidase [Planctomycetota bacterium]